MAPYGETFTKVYDRLFGAHADRAAQVLLRFLGGQISGNALPHVLDLGCGTGQAVLRFLEAGYPVAGLDLSPSMIAAAKDRCSPFALSGQVQWVVGDMARFELTGPFGMVFSTYNSLNHLESMDRLKACFRSVRRSLSSQGWFVFDYHTLKGLGEWSDREEGHFPSGQVVVDRSTDATHGKASMKVTGVWAGEKFEENVDNHSFELSRVAGWLKEEGYHQVAISDWENLPRPVRDPEQETRVVFCAQ